MTEFKISPVTHDDLSYNNNYMAMSTIVDHDEYLEKTSSEISERVPMNVCPPSNFPDKFQDFFTALTEDGDDLSNMLEDKLIPRYLKGIFYCVASKQNRLLLFCIFFICIVRRLLPIQ